MEATTFKTALGTFGIGWSDAGLVRVLLPGDDDAVLDEKLARTGARHARPTRAIAGLMDLIEDYADGQRVDFSEVTLDLGGVPDFGRRAYDVLRTVGWGETRSYGDVARALGDVGLSRAVGQAMGANPMPLIIPCHRVLASDGRPGGFSASGGASAKIRMLALEGVRIGTPAGQMTFGF